MKTTALILKNYDRELIWIFGCLAVVLLGAYLYLVQASIYSVVDRQDGEERITELEAEVATLEAQYSALSSRINLDYAYSLGYQDASGKTFFALNKEPGAGLSMLAN